MVWKSLSLGFLVFLLTIGLSADAATYYVSQSTGSDANTGLTMKTPLQSIEKVNGLDHLDPGDRVLFKCGDTWRKETLNITWSGTENNKIFFGSYPCGCGDKPVISGSLPVTGWKLYRDDIYEADLTAGGNAARFGTGASGILGLNQLFRDGRRLLLARWPNLDDPHDNGYSTIDQAVSDTVLVDNELPPRFVGRRGGTY